MYNSIVVGYDESLSSKAALKEASRWVKVHGGKIFLVHAVYFDQEEFAILPSQMENGSSSAPPSALMQKRRSMMSSD